MEKRHFICHSCGKKIEGGLDQPPCELLQGWVVATHWKQPESVNQHFFCSFSCLKRWADANVPKIPDVFMNSFGDENSKH